MGVLFSNMSVSETLESLSKPQMHDKEKAHGEASTDMTLKRAIKNDL